jgi:preprotein translocase subunit SecB
MADNDIPTETGANGAGENGEMESVPFMIGAQYIKDFSFENPRGIETLSSIQQNPDVNVDVSTNARAIGEEGMFEVLLFIRAEAQVDDSPVFIVELTYGGVVQVTWRPRRRGQTDRPHRRPASPVPVCPLNRLERGT